MHQTTKRLLATSILVGAGASVFLVSSSGAEFSGSVPPATAVVSYPPDGGSDVNIIASVRLESRVSTGPGETIGVSAADGAKLEVDATVTNTPAVTVSGVPTVALENGTQVALTTASLNAITYSTGRGVCTYNAGDPDSLTVSTVENIPASPLSGRTAVTIWNLESGTKQLWCYPLSTASATAGVPIFSQTSMKFDGLNGGNVSCLCSSGSCSYAYLEEKCYQQAP